jgi:hypothetical protein
MTSLFTSKARAKPSEALSGAPLYGRLLAFLINIRIGWKGLTGFNTLAFYEQS